MLPDDRHRAEEETPGWIRDARAGGVLPATNGEAPIDEQETARVPSLAAIEILKKQWLNLPIFDLEYTPGYELAEEDLALWHQAQLEQRAKAIGCTVLMASILEELARIWLQAQRPSPHRSPMACHLIYNLY